MDSSPLPSPSGLSPTGSFSRGASAYGDRAGADSLVGARTLSPPISRAASFNAISSSSPDHQHFPFRSSPTESPSTLTHKSLQPVSRSPSRSRSADMPLSPGPHVLIKCPSPDAADQSIPDQVVRLDEVRASAAQGPSIGDLKAHVSRTWPGKPLPSGMRFIRHGKLCDDDYLLVTSQGSSSESGVTLHLVIRSDAWSDKAAVTPSHSRHASGASARSTGSSRAQSRLGLLSPEQLRSSLSSARTSRANSRRSSPHRLRSAAMSREPSQSDSQYFARAAPPSAATPQHIAARIRDWMSYESIVADQSGAAGDRSVQAILSGSEERAAMIRDMAGAAYHLWLERYEEVWAELTEQPAATVRSSHLSKAREVAAACDYFETHVLSLGSAPRRPCSTDKGTGTEEAREVRARINGVLHALTFPTAPFYEDRVAFLSDVLSTRLQPLLCLLQQFDSQTAEQRQSTVLSALLDQARAGGPTLGAMAANAAGQAAGAVAGEAREVRRGIQQTAALYVLAMGPVLFAILPSLFFLAFHCSVVYVMFIRDGNWLGWQKRLVTGLLVLAFLFRALLLYRTESIRQRRLQNGEAQAQAPRATDDAPENSETSANRQQTAQQVELEAARREAEQETQDAQPVPSPVVPIRNTAHSIVDPMWWVERLAFWGLDEEDAELGLRSARRPHASPQVRPRSAFSRMLKVVDTFIVLLLVSLIPNVEQRRREAIIDREDLIRRTAREERERQERNAARNEKRLSLASEQMATDLPASESAGPSSAPNRPAAAPASPPPPAPRGVPTVLRSPYTQRLLRAVPAPAARPDLGAGAANGQEDDWGGAEEEFGFF